ncbi:proton-conducting transporter membrane subunit [Amnibacterium endophyticum]|uniref:Proton-conducting transporter membrane subunit n=1 Tax=Amnibacterium endophyticum TaxID=2109337 RepID=A0ABW4LGN2_9MICO
MSALLPLAFLLPAITGGVLLLTGRRANGAAPAVAITVAAATVAVAIAAAVVRPRVAVPFLPGAPFEAAMPGLSAVLLPVVTVVAALVLVFAAAERTGPAARFHGLMLLFTGAVVLTVVAASLPALLLAWEVMGATSYALIGFVWRDPVKTGAGFVAFTVTRTADLGLYLAAGAAVAGGAGLQLDALAAAQGPWLHVVAAGVVVAALGKAAQLPFSFWLSRAMEGPSAVSALLHSAAMVAMGGYLLVRMEPLLAATRWAGPVTAWIGAATAVLLGLVAIAQQDLKQVLAASTASQLGFVVLAAGAGTVAGGTAQLVAHAAVKSLLFLVAGAWLAALGTKQLPALIGVGRRYPLIGVAFTVGAAALAGLPPLPLWLSKETVLAAAAEQSPALYAAGLLGAGVAAAYSARILVLIWRRPPASAEAGFDSEEPGSRRVPGAASTVMVLLTGAAVLLPLAWLPGLQPAWRGLLGAGGAPAATPLELTLSAGIAVVVAVSTIPLARAAGRLPTGWLGLEPAAQLLVARPAGRVAALLAAGDDRILARIPAGGVAGAVTRAAGWFAAVDERGITGAMTGIAALTGRAARRVRAWQTGRLEHYFTAAVVATVALAVVLIVAR